MLPRPIHRHLSALLPAPAAALPPHVAACSSAGGGGRGHELYLQKHACMQLCGAWQAVATQIA